MFTWWKLYHNGSIYWKYVTKTGYKVASADGLGDQVAADVRSGCPVSGTSTDANVKYAYQFIRDIQSGNITPDENKSFRDYITEYQINAKNDQIHKFAYTFGLDETKLRKFMKSNVTPQDINAYGKFDELKSTADKLKAKRYFEQKEGISIPPFKALIKLDDYLRKFIFEGGFDIEISDEK